MTQPAKLHHHHHHHAAAAPTGIHAGVSDAYPPEGFLNELIAWGKSAPAEIFAQNARNDVYSSVLGVLGPYRDVKYRRAVMLEVMRVLARLESKWRWDQGRDTKNTPVTAPQEEWEAGAWQVSADGMGWGPDLRALVSRYGKTDAVSFQALMKQNHQVAMEYIARLLRYTIDANGPVKRGEIKPFLRKDAVEEFVKLL